MITLILALSKPTHAQPPKDRLPFKLVRRLGEIQSVPIDPKPPIDAPKPNPFGRLVSGCQTLYTNRAQSWSICHSFGIDGQALSRCLSVTPKAAKGVQNCLDVGVIVFSHLKNCTDVLNTPNITLRACVGVGGFGGVALRRCASIKMDAVHALVNCSAINGAKTKLYRVCAKPRIDAVIHFKTCFDYAKQSSAVQKCTHLNIIPSHRVPCRFYPIKQSTDNDEARACPMRPKSHQLHFALQRKRGQLSADKLPFYLECWRKKPAIITPSKESYIVHNTVTATIDGLSIDPLSFSIKTDISGFCWQGQIEINQTSYNKIRHLLERARGDERVISVVINGFTFAIICEDVSKNRSFVNHSYTLSGRSITARLSADYAHAQSGLVIHDNYASQIVNAQIANLPFTVDFNIDDWLIPANHLSLTDKTPIAVMNDIADAAGAILTSDPSQPVLTIKPKYKAKAWELAHTTPDRIIALDIIKNISEQKRTSTRYNTVTLTGQAFGAIVHRAREGRDMDAGVIDNPLFTDQIPMIAKGCQVLSDSGNHMNVTITTRWAPKYQLDLAVLGDVWQINDTEGPWRGIVVSVAVDVKLENDVPTIWQTVGLDRYLDV